jgi:hypothetical protein
MKIKFLDFFHDHNFFPCFQTGQNPASECSGQYINRYWIFNYVWLIVWKFGQANLHSLAKLTNIKNVLQLAQVADYIMVYLNGKMHLEHLAYKYLHTIRLQIWWENNNNVNAVWVFEKAQWCLSRPRELIMPCQFSENAAISMNMPE